VRSIYRWLNRGKTATRGEFWQFWQAYEQALGVAEATLIERLIGAGQEEPKIWQWILERRYSERWSLKERLELSGPQGEPIRYSVTEQQKAKLAHVQRRLSRSLTGRAAHDHR
jgi:hypothetical protein